MTSTELPKKLTEKTLQKIISQFDQPVLLRSNVYPDGGIDPLWPRFERAVMNQAEGGEATLSRYAIWANTVRDNVIVAIDLIDKGNDAEAKALLIRAANSLSAFSEAQSYFDPYR